MAQERLQKILAAAGLASRRAAERLVTAGRVRVNGRVVSELGAKADPRKDRIEVDGKRIALEKPIYIAMNKPRNVVSTLSDPEGRPTIKEYIKGVSARLYPVGRLEYAASGVLLLTNDGEFTHALTSPVKRVPKTYVLKLDREIDAEDLDRWQSGIAIEADGGGAQQAKVADAHLLRNEGGKSWIEVTLTHALPDQLARMTVALGYQLMRVVRVSFAGIEATGLRPGEWRPLTGDEQKLLKRAYGVPKAVREQRELSG